MALPRLAISSKNGGLLDKMRRQGNNRFRPPCQARRAQGGRRSCFTHLGMPILLDKKANKMVRCEIRPRVEMCPVAVIFDNRSRLKEVLGNWLLVVGKINPKRRDFER